MTVASAAILLFLVMDPLGNIPAFLTAMQGVEPSRHNRVLIRELLIAYFVMVVFLFAGGPLISLLGISEPALTIAGGLILFLIALRMVFPAPDRGLREDIGGEPLVVPLAIPYVAGPSVLATELLLMSKEPGRWLEWVAGLSIAWVATAGILLLGSRLRAFLGKRGLLALERLTGMILITLAVQMFLSGVAKFAGEMAKS